MECQECGAEILPDRAECDQCGHSVAKRTQDDPQHEDGPLKDLRILGGPGDSFETAISIKGVYDSAIGVKVEYFILEKTFGRPGHDWVLHQQNLHRRGDLSYDLMHLQLSDEKEVTVYFEITDFFKSIREIISKVQNELASDDVQTDTNVQLGHETEVGLPEPVHLEPSKPYALNNVGESETNFLQIQDVVKSYYPDADLDLLRAAYIYSAQMHENQRYAPGERRLGHQLSVAGILARMKMNEACVAAGLLHDAVGDNLATVSDIEHVLGQEIAALVDGFTGLGEVQYESGDEQDAENHRKTILSMCRDIRVLLIKLADCLDSMRTLDLMPKQAQQRISREAREIYAPLAGRLGIDWIGTEIEDLAFRYLEPGSYNDIRARLEESLKEPEQYLKNVLRTVDDKLQKCQINAVTKGRVKGLWRIHQKMMSQNLKLDEVNDIIRILIILAEVSECYTVLGLMHSLWRPAPGWYQDYIAMPGADGYQSVHTTVIGPEGHRIEIKIRTREMHWIAEHEDAYPEVDDPREFLSTVRVEVYSDEVYAFTPRGDVMEFPKGATALDFAYAIHSEVGNRCVDARVNGEPVSLEYELKTGDTVDIVTSANQKPCEEWLKYVKTHRARRQIKRFLRADGVCRQ